MWCVLSVLALVLVGLVGLAYRAWYDATHFVWADDAQVSGSIIQVGALNAGQVRAVLSDVGQTVQEGQTVARISVPQPIAATANGTPKLGFTNTVNQQVDVTSPLTGVVVARLADPGSTVTVGQPIVAVVEPTKLTIAGNVSETNVNRIKVGDPVDVTVDSLGMTLPGRSRRHLRRAQHPSRCSLSRFRRATLRTSSRWCRGVSWWSTAICL